MLDKFFKKFFFKYIITGTLAFLLSVSSFAEQISFKTFNGKTLCEYTGLDTIEEINGAAAFVYNLETGSVIYSKNPDDVVYPASTVKIMTAIVAYENIPDLSVPITASKSAVTAARGSNMALKAGETLTAEQLLYGLLVVGANDAANVLAEYVAGDIDTFCTMMNEKAKEIGAKNTVFKNPTGLHHEEMKTTARDIAVISGCFYKTGNLLAMSDTTRYIVPKTEYTNTQRTLVNRNLLISRMRSDDYYYSPAQGISLGDTPEAGECIVSSCVDDSGLTYICAVLNARSTEKDEKVVCDDAINLLGLCLKSFTYASVVSSKNVVCEIPVKLASDTDYVTLFPSGEVKALLPVEFNYAKDITIEPRVSEKYAVAPVYEGEKYGEAIVKYKDDIVLGTVDLVAGKSIDKSNVLYFLDRAEGIVASTWFKVFAITAIVLFALYFGASVAYTRRRRLGRRRR